MRQILIPAILGIALSSCTTVVEDTGGPIVYNDGYYGPTLGVVGYGGYYGGSRWYGGGNRWHDGGHWGDHRGGGHWGGGGHGGGGHGGRR